MRYHFSMAQLLVRDLSAQAVEALKRRAAANGRSAEAEHRAILESVLGADKEAWLARARVLREETAGRILGDSTEIIREFRDAR